MTLLARLLTELVGTFLFVSVIALVGPIGPLAPLAIGSALMVMVYMGGHVSGAHYNPAISLALLLRGKLGPADMGLYWVVQLLGAALAFVFAHQLGAHAGGIHPGTGVQAGSALGVEFVFTLALSLVVLNVATTRATQGNSFYGLAIGFTIAAAAFAGGPISGGAYNPAVGIGATLDAAIFGGGSWGDLWIYLVGPLAGASLGALIHSIQVAGTEMAAEPPEGHPSPGAPAPVPEGSEPARRG